jgi:hypothetical protein
MPRESVGPEKTHRRSKAVSQGDSKPAGFSEEEKIKILLAEYTSLRSELNARLSSMYTVAAFSTVAITWFVSESREHTEVFWGWLYSLL